MPKIGMEPVRRAALVDATIAEIGAAGSLDVTVSRIAKRAGMSSGLAHHYFGGKDQIFLAAMHHILGVYGRAVRKELTGVIKPRARLEAIIRASFEAGNFKPEVISAWLNFYVQAQKNVEARRLLRVYQMRLMSNLTHELRALVGPHATEVANSIAALIDGFYIRQALRGGMPDGVKTSQSVLRCLDMMIAEFSKETGDE